MPETEKLLLLGKTFQVSMDVLLRDELTLGEAKEVYTCGNNAVQEKKQELFEGILIKESVADDAILDFLHVHKIELWNAGGKPKYWTALFFTSAAADFPELVSKVMLSDSGSGSWFVDFKAGQVKYIVFKDKILKYKIGNPSEKEYVCNECRKMGILDEQMNWPE